MFDELKDCIKMTHYIIERVKINENIFDDKKYTPIFSVEEVNKQVLSGIPFRDAYKNVGLAIEEGDFNPDTKINHTHEGSIGNLCNDKIENLMADIIRQFDFQKVENAENNLLK